MSIKLQNTSEYVDKRGTTDWWNWTAYIDVTDDDNLDEVSYVEYYLHPSFKNPIRRVKEKEGGFPLKTSGWGVFLLRAKVFFKDTKKKPLSLEHYLKFGN